MHKRQMEKLLDHFKDSFAYIVHVNSYTQKGIISPFQKHNTGF